MLCLTDEASAVVRMGATEIATLSLSSSVKVQTTL